MNDTLVTALEPLHADAYGWALHCCEGAHAEAADVLQNAYLKVIRGKVVWHGLSNLKPWWFGVIRFSAREEQRRRLFRETLPGKILRLDVEPDEALPPPLVELDETAREFRRCLARLPARQSEVLHLVFYQDLSLSEAAVIMALIHSDDLAATGSALDFETEARLEMALQIARERNDEALVDQVKKASMAIQSITSPPEHEPILREVETAVGIDPGGWSMAGQPLFRPSPAIIDGSPAIRAKLDAALLSGSLGEISGVITEWGAVLGDQAGLPDGRRPGDKPGPLTLNEAAATRLFIEALKSEGRAVRELSAGRPLPDQMLRFYGYLLDGLATLRPSLQDHAPDDLAAIDALARGTATVLISLQQPEGHFPFPDLRGKNIRFGEMIDKRLEAGEIEIREGWVVSADPDGGSQFDTGVCGVSLLRAGAVFDEPTWTAAGLRAAEWAMRQRLVTNFNCNAFSVSLLAQAGLVSGKKGYLDDALQKFRIGVAPGQSGNGRWIDSHNARTVYHLIILRAMGDLLGALPAERDADIAEVKAVAEPALEALLTEFDAMGITVECLPELHSLLPHVADLPRLRTTLDAVSASLVEKCTDGTRVKLGAQPHQLAAVAAWLRER